MGEPALTNHWLPQDDLLLKNAVEAGASLEALAKGVVKFSRSFSLQELRDRWHSLLYDLDVAIEASLRMIEAEASGFSLQSNGSPGKRKAESVRQRYYAMHKRIVNVPFESWDLDYLENESDPLVTKFFSGDQPTNHERNQELVGTIGATFPTDGFPSVALDAGCCDKDNTFLGQSKFVQIGGLGHPEEPQESDSLDHLDLGDIVFPESGCFRFDTSIPDSLASFLEGVDGAGDSVRVLDPTLKMIKWPLDTVNHFQEQVTNGSFGNFDSNTDRLLSCEQISRLSKSLINFNDEEELLLNRAVGYNEITDEWTSFFSVEECTEIPTAAQNEESQTVEKCRFENPTPVCSAATRKVSSALEVNPMHPNLPNGVLCCTLNTEDTEIPDNDDAFLPICLASTSKSWMEQMKSDDSYYPVPFLANELLHRSQSLNRFEQTREEAGYRFTDQNTDAIHADLEGFSNESDGEVPYYSDVEEMINDMDLCPDDYGIDVSRNPTVLKYKNDDARRRIIKLEQAAKAATDRYIAAHGAYAILYGRHSDHFIKKPEVVIGRETDDVKVDIDLKKESCAPTVSRRQVFSRRQATLKLEKDGTFHLSNHGKSPIFVNGKAMVPGQSSSLISGCLIEIREVALLFETNEKSCKAAAAEVHSVNR